MQYTLAGFTNHMSFRIFQFVCTTDEHTRSIYHVSADLGAISRYGIRIQDLPLLCRGLLDGRDQAENRRAFTYTEADMRRYADSCAIRAAEVEKKKPARRPPPAHLELPWRQRLAPSGLGARVLPATR